MWGGLTLTLHQLELILAAALMPSLETIVSNATLFWFFAIVALCVIFFTCYYIPETKNRDLSSVSNVIIIRFSSPVFRSSLSSPSWGR